MRAILFGALLLLEMSNMLVAARVRVSNLLSGPERVLVVTDIAGNAISGGFLALYALESRPTKVEDLYFFDLEDRVARHLLGPMPAPGIFFDEFRVEVEDESLLNRPLFLVIGDGGEMRDSPSFGVIDLQLVFSRLDGEDPELLVAPVDASSCIVWGMIGRGRFDLSSIGGGHQQESAAFMFPALTARPPDTDGDGLGYFAEVRLGTDPCAFDSDGNGVSDGREDFDSDGMSNQEEEIFGTDPRDPSSKFELIVRHQGGPHLLTFPMAENRDYRIERSDNLIDWEPVITVTMYDQEGDEVDLGAPSAGDWFYRVIAERGF